MYLSPNNENETYQDLYESIELESQEIESNILSSIALYTDDSVSVFYDFMRHAQEEGIENDIYECLLTVLADAASSEDDHNPMTRVVRAAARFEANKIAVQNFGYNKKLVFEDDLDRIASRRHRIQNGADMF